MNPDKPKSYGLKIIKISPRILIALVVLLAIGHTLISLPVPAILLAFVGCLPLAFLLALNWRIGGRVWLGVVYGAWFGAIASAPLLLFPYEQIEPLPQMLLLGLWGMLGIMTPLVVFRSRLLLYVTRGR